MNATISQNKEKIDNYFMRWLRTDKLFVFGEFSQPTGYEAFVTNDRAKPVMRKTYGVTVLLRYDPNSVRGWHIVSAWPNNSEWKK